jgi:hypothetical protein
MKALQAYIDRKNKWNAMFRGEQFEIQTQAGRQRVADLIDCELSPENLSCDGELSATQTRHRYLELTRVAQQLVQLDPTVKIYEFYTGE